ncbi:MAG: rod shape-determining protein MreC [Minisyncoccota bacterium]
MKRTFLAKRNAFLSSANISWGGYALIVAVLLLAMRLVAPNLFWQAFAPVFRSADSLAAGSHAFFSGFGDTAKLSLENENLTSENAALASENQSLLEKEASLETLLASSAPRKGATPEVLAGVVARPPESPYDTLVLAAGARAGVAPGQEVFGAGNVPIGVISSVLTDFSRVTLFSSPGMSVAGWVGSANVPLTITGAGAGSMDATLARSANIAVGDSVSSPGPGMLPIGKVTRIDGDPSSPSITLRIMPSLNLFSISWVTVRDTGAAFVKALLQATSTLP